MKELKIRIFIMFLLYFVLCIILASCSQNKPVVVTTNNFLQENFDYDCLDGTKTFTEIIICYQSQTKSERIQNELTNSLILDNQI